MSAGFAAEAVATNRTQRRNRLDAAEAAQSGEIEKAPVVPTVAQAHRGECPNHAEALALVTAQLAVAVARRLWRRNFRTADLPSYHDHCRLLLIG
jgi:hypothetical protein